MGETRQRPRQSFCTMGLDLRTQHPSGEIPDVFD